MDNLKLARETLYIENQKIVIVNDNSIVYKADSFGIKPLFIAFNTIKDKMKGSSCADRVIGKAAALIYKKAQIKELYCDIITTAGKEVLQNNGINVTYIEEIDYVQNREKNGMCPVETLAKDETDFDNLLKNIEKFLKEKNLL